ncbi:MAG: hypothetical protein EA377_07955 [Phycisphaerales bacterium]|nr:MAG: hypothetical protein EA377_07955 [Phycisphaerales bacterium]
MLIIPLDRLVPHPDNANRMTSGDRAKLMAHVRETGRYPAIIVRPHPDPNRDGDYQVLDGHHRLEVLRELGYERANCEVWDVTDDQATLLLLTLNRLRGEDDPEKRGALIQRLAQKQDVRDLLDRLPDPPARVEKLLDLHAGAPAVRKPPRLEAMPHAITFFLTGAQRNRLLSKLKKIDRDRSVALVHALDLDRDAAEIAAQEGGETDG